MWGTGAASRDDRAGRWEQRTALPLTLLSVVFLAAYAAPILQPAMPAVWRRTCAAAIAVIWLLFWLDFIIRLTLAADRWAFLRAHVFDLAVLLLPVLRPLAAVRLVMVVLTITRRTEKWARGRLAVYVGTTTLLLVLVAALAALDAERRVPNGGITTFGEALWWATVTITTVGYGDYFPVTTAGRAVAVGLMIGGIGLIGFVTGSLASWIVERVGSRDEASAPATAADIAALQAEIAALRRLYESRLPSPAPGSGQAPGQRSGNDRLGAGSSLASEDDVQTDERA
ncbi:MAG TPA: ion channel [Micromonosporaceae bacterium]